MKFRYKGRAKGVNVIFSEGDSITVNHDRAIRMMQGHPNFEEVKRGRKNGSHQGEYGDSGASESGETEL